MTGWQPVTGQLITRWGADVTPENAWQAYSRPQLVRQQWRNLNGLWDYTVAPVEMEMVQGIFRSNPRTLSGSNRRSRG